MWPYSSRCWHRSGDPLPKLALELDWKVFSSNDEETKFNPTDQQRTTLDWLCSRWDCSRNDVLLALMFRHLYGMPALENLKVRAAEDKVNSASGIWPPVAGAVADGSGTRFSRARDVEVNLDREHIGKVDAKSPITLRLPSRMLSDLQEIAAAHGIAAAGYLRKLLVVELDGEIRHTPWQKARSRIVG